MIPWRHKNFDDINTQHKPQQFFSGRLVFLSRYANTRPILIAIDDFHAADELSIHLAEQIAKRLARHQTNKTKTSNLQMSLFLHRRGRQKKVHRG